jgi:nucleotide-binding universal stress UspA family protein
VLAGEAAELEAARRRRAERDLRAAAAVLERAGWRVRSVVRLGVPIDELLAETDAARGDLLAVGARGRTGLERALLGSVAEGALKRSRVPVLVAR